MWSYEKRLQYPVNIKETNAKLASVIMAQFGGPNGFSPTFLYRFFAEKVMKIPFQIKKLVLYFPSSFSKKGRRNR